MSSNQIKPTSTTIHNVVPARFTNQSNERYGYLSCYIAFSHSSKTSKDVRCILCDNFVHGSVLIARSNQNLFQKRMDAYSCYAYKTSEHFLLRESGNSFFPTRIIDTTHNLVFLKVIIRLSSHSQDLH
jgi:hypothetical protein